MKKIEIYFLILITLITCTNPKKLKNDLTQNQLNGKVKTVKEYEYNALQKFGSIQKGELETYKIFSYDERGYEVSKAFYLKSGQIAHWDSTVYTYQNNNLPLEFLRYNKKGELELKYCFIYDENKNRLEGHNFNKNGSLKYQNIYSFDEFGNEIKWECFNSDGSIKSTNKYSYDTKNRVIEDSFYGYDGKLISVDMFQYNDKGDISVKTHRTDYVNFDSEYLYSYKDYDKMGNWTVKISYLEGKPYMYFEREITYY